MTRDEVIRALECCILRDPDDRPRCGKCPYPSGSACSNRLKVDALAMLKEKPKLGTWKEDTSEGMSPGGTPSYVCGFCGGSEHFHGVEFPKRKVFCDRCGAVLVYPWENTVREAYRP